MILFGHNRFFLFLSRIIMGIMMYNFYRSRYNYIIYCPIWIISDFKNVKKRTGLHPRNK